MAQNQSGNQWNSTLKRRTPLKPKSGIKRPFNSAKKSPKVRAKLFSTPKAKAPLKKVSKKHKRALEKTYYPQQGRFLKFPENRYCWICIGRSLGATRSEIRGIMLLRTYQSDTILSNAGAIITPSREVHHYAGRIGRLLDFMPYFIPECRECREWPHQHLREARELDLIASRTAYDAFPENAVELWDTYKKESSYDTKIAT